MEAVRTAARRSPLRTGLLTRRRPCWRGPRAPRRGAARWPWPPRRRSSKRESAGSRSSQPQFARPRAMRPPPGRAPRAPRPTRGGRGGTAASPQGAGGARDEGMGDLARGLARRMSMALVGRGVVGGREGKAAETVVGGGDGERSWGRRRKKTESGRTRANPSGSVPSLRFRGRKLTHILREYSTVEPTQRSCLPSKHFENTALAHCI
jgi:hypothetical protein